MQKTVVRNPNQSSIRRNLLNIAGISVQGETITPQNGDRLLGGYGVAWLNNQDAASQTTGQDNPLPECNCESGGGGGSGGEGGGSGGVGGGSGGEGGGSGGGGGVSGPGGGVQPSGNCEKKNISELKQILDEYANQSFCDKEFPEVQFSTFIGYDKPLSDSTAQEIELRMLCPVDDCNDDDDELCENPDNLPVNPVSLNNSPALYAVQFTVQLTCDYGRQVISEYSYYDVFKVEPNTTTDKYDAAGYDWYYFYPEDLQNIVQGWLNQLVGCSSSSCACCDSNIPHINETWGDGSGSGYSSSSIYLFGASCCRDLRGCDRYRTWTIEAKTVGLSEACET